MTSSLRACHALVAQLRMVTRQSVAAEHAGDLAAKRAADAEIAEIVRTLELLASQAPRSSKPSPENEAALVAAMDRGEASWYAYLAAFRNGDVLTAERLGADFDRALEEVRRLALPGKG